MSAGFSRAKSRPISRLRNRRSSRWSLISERPRYTGSRSWPSLLARAGEVTLVTHFVALAQGRLKTLPIDLDVPLAPIAIFTLKNRTISPVAQLFIEQAREMAKTRHK